MKESDKSAVASDQKDVTSSWMMLGMTAIQGQNFTEAQQYFIKVIESNPNIAMAWLGKAIADFMLIAQDDDIERASEAFRAAGACLETGAQLGASESALHEAQESIMNALAAIHLRHLQNTRESFENGVEWANQSLQSLDLLMMQGQRDNIPFLKTIYRLVTLDGNELGVASVVDDLIEESHSEWDWRLKTIGAEIKKHEPDFIIFDDPSLKRR